jgi:hypothetical protein
MRMLRDDCGRHQPKHNPTYRQYSRIPLTVCSTGTPQLTVIASAWARDEQSQRPTVKGFPVGKQCLHLVQGEPYQLVHFVLHPGLANAVRAEERDCVLGQRRHRADAGKA